MSLSPEVLAALQHPANAMPEVLTNWYSEVRIVGGRCAAVWRGGDNPKGAAVNRHTVRDFKEEKTWNVWEFVTGPVGLSKQEAVAYLLCRAGIVDTPQAKRKAARRVAADKRQDERQDKRRKAYNAAQLARSLELQGSAPTEGTSAYLQRKGIETLWETHRVAPAVKPDGETVPGLVYVQGNAGAFIQLVMRDLAGNVTGYQRIYDDPERGKRFVSGTKPNGAFVLLEPVDSAPRKGAMLKSKRQFLKLPKSGDALAALLESGHEVAIVEGFATGASVALARPKAFVLCALSAGNLGNVAEVLRKQYGHTRTLKTDRGQKRKALDLCIWGDLDESKTGQQKTHKAALENDCSVRLPKFKQGFGDFNDLHLARGLEAVRRTRKVTPDVTLAFAKELSKQQLSPDKHLAPIALPDSGGALIVKSAQETGKTHQLAALLSGSGLRVLMVVHRESLARNLAARLKFDCYLDILPHLLRDARQLVCCFDSLQKLTIGGGALPDYDVVVLDESEQVLRHVTGRHIKHKIANFAVFEHYLKTAPRIICADADAGRLTLDTLKSFSPGRVIRWQKHEHHVAAGRRLRLTVDRDDLLDAFEAEERPAWYATDSLRHTRDLSAYLDDPATLTINSETSSTPDAAAYLLNPTREAPKHRRMIASPSVQTGLSDDSGYWTHVFGSFSGYTSTPEDAVQAILRPRRAETLTVYAARGHGEAISVEDAFKQAKAVDEHEARRLGRDTFGEGNEAYETLRAEVVSQRSRRQANYRQRFVLKAALLGYEITYDLPRDLSENQTERRHDRRSALKEAGLERYSRDRVSAERIDAARADVLGEKHGLTQAELFALEQYKLRAFYTLPDDVTDDDLAEMLRRDDYGALREKVLRYENLVEPYSVAEAHARGELDKGVLKSDAQAHLLRHDFGRQLGKVVGLNAETEAEAATWQEETDRLEGELRTLRTEAAEAKTRRKGEIAKQVERLEANLEAHKLKTLGVSYTADSEAVKAFVEWCSENYPALSETKLVTSSLENLRLKPVEVIRDSLKRCGLSHKGQNKNRGDVYAVTFLSVSAMCNYSRPRREKWGFEEQTDIENPLYDSLLKTPVLASGTGLITDAENAKATPHSEESPTPPRPPAAAPAGELPTPRQVPGYERLRAHVRFETTGKARAALLDTFGRADNGDGEALAVLTTYLQHPQVRDAIGLGA